MVRICIYKNRFPDFFFFFSRVWKFINVSLSINMVLCFKENLFIVAYIFLIVFEHCGLIAHLFREIKKVNLFYCYPQTYYQRHCLSYSEFLLQNLLCATDWLLLIMRLVVFFWLIFNQIICVYIFKN